MKENNFTWPPPSELLAEFIGILLGDGSSYYNKKSHNWQIRIVGHSDEKDYYQRHIRNLCEALFGLSPQIRPQKNKKAIVVAMDRKNIGNFLHSVGFPAGNKILRKATIPCWIKEDDAYLRACIRGIIDTDGSIQRMSNQDPNLLRICFTCYGPELMRDVRESLIYLGFYPSKVIVKKHIFLSRKTDIARYLKEIGFANEKHSRRYHQFSPVV